VKLHCKCTFRKNTPNVGVNLLNVYRSNHVCLDLIIESVNSLCRDSSDTQYMMMQKNLSNLKDGKLISRAVGSSPGVGRLIDQSGDAAEGSEIEVHV